MTDGGLGRLPYWYNLIAAARYLKVPVWELADQPIFWMHAAIAAMNAEAHYEKMASKK